jgi:hypothetical protein
VRTGIVLGYGVKLDEAYTRYLDGVVSMVHDLDRLILCGGYTARQINLSEAHVMLEYLMGIRGVRLPMELETASIDTIHNLRFARRMTNERGENVVIFCDQPRRFKVRWMARQLFGPGAEVRPISRQHSWLKAWMQYLVQTPVEIFAFHWPWLHGMFLARRRKRWGLPDLVK